MKLVLATHNPGKVRELLPRIRAFVKSSGVEFSGKKMLHSRADAGQGGRSHLSAAVP